MCVYVCSFVVCVTVWGCYGHDIALISLKTDNENYNIASYHAAQYYNGGLIGGKAGMWFNFSNYCQ